MSCRRGIKDGDCGCCKSLAAKVRELYQRCANAIKSVNGINPDGANNFDILAGAGIQVNPRANGIEIVSLIDDSDKVDKLDTAGDYAYTHNGATQGETPIEDGTTAATIPIRDANGRMQAADPANGATDKTLVTANWVSQTGNSSPNNLVHRSGDETISQNKTYIDVLEADNLVGLYKNGVRADGVGMRKMFVRTASNVNHIELMINILPRRATFGAGILFAGCHYSSNIEMHWIAQGTIPDSRKTNFAISTELDADNNVVCTIWQVNTGSTDIYSMSIIANCNNGNMGQKHNFIPTTDDAIYTVTASGYTDGDGVVHTFTQYTASS